MGGVWKTHDDGRDQAPALRVMTRGHELREHERRAAVLHPYWAKKWVGRGGIQPDMHITPMIGSAENTGRKEIAQRDCAKESRKALLARIVRRTPAERRRKGGTRETCVLCIVMSPRAERGYEFPSVGSRREAAEWRRLVTSTESKSLHPSHLVLKEVPHRARREASSRSWAATAPERTTLCARGVQSAEGRARRGNQGYIEYLEAHRADEAYRS